MPGRSARASATNVPPPAASSVPTRRRLPSSRRGSPAFAPPPAGAAGGLLSARRRLVPRVPSPPAVTARLAGRDFVTPVPSLGRADEFGAIATTLEALRAGAAEADRLAVERQSAQEAEVNRAV